MKTPKANKHYAINYCLDYTDNKKGKALAFPVKFFHGVLRRWL